MSRLKSLFGVAVLTAIAGVVPQAHAQANLKVMIAGASGAWQAMALGTFKAGACPTGSSAGCAHYTNKNFNLTDTRPGLIGGTNVNDVNAIWIVWDNTTADPTCATSCNVWAYIKVDSIVGDRCYFAQPHCNVNVSSFPAPVGAISSALWGADSTPPAPVAALFTTGALVTVASTEIRPEDALFGQCRINSKLGGGNDGLNGLGYISAGGTNAAGTCPAFGASLTNLEGQDLLSGLPGGSASTAHTMAFNISGKDPFTGTAIPVFTALSLGAYPLIFITNRQGALANVTDATLPQLQAAFSGANCQGNNFAGGTAGNIAVYIREPLSGTMNTAEYSAFRLPRDSSGNYDLVNGTSQETGVNSANPVNNLACGVGGSRYSVIGTGEEVSAVQNSNTKVAEDGIGYTFFSYGNISGIANNANYAYLTVNGVDPIFSAYANGTAYDPGQPTTAGVLPAAANLPAACAGAFPCSETQIWKGHVSFPNLRNGSYRQWALVRLISNGTALANARVLVSSSQASAVTTVPDLVPAVATSGDKGLQLFRSHYTQQGVAPANNPTDKGGDEGGCIVPNGSVGTKLVQRAGGCVVGP